MADDWRVEADDGWLAAHSSNSFARIRRRLSSFGRLADAVSQAELGPYGGTPRNPRLKIGGKAYSVVRYAEHGISHTAVSVDLERCRRCGALLVETHRLIQVGGATGLIGDPRPESERQLNSKETVAAWVDKIRAQIEPFLDFAGPFAARVVNNLDWTADLSALDFLRDIGKHFRINKMIAKEAVSARLHSDAGISYTEFSYQILQGMDYLELFRRYGCRLQTGGSDQWGNLTAGTDLIRRVTGESVHLLATPLLTSASGEKVGKSTGGGGLWLDPAMTSPYAFYQHFVNAEDATVGQLLRILTFLDREEVAALEKEAAERPAARVAQRRLAEEVATLVHGDAETRQAIAASLNEARRTVAEGGAYVNNRRVDDADAAVPAEALLHGRWLVLRRGKRTVAGVEVL